MLQSSLTKVPYWPELVNWWKKQSFSQDLKVNLQKRIHASSTDILKEDIQTTDTPSGYAPSRDPFQSGHLEKSCSGVPYNHSPRGQKLPSSEQHCWLSIHSRYCKEHVASEMLQVLCPLYLWHSNTQQITLPWQLIWFLPFPQLLSGEEEHLAQWLTWQL